MNLLDKVKLRGTYKKIQAFGTIEEYPEPLKLYPGSQK